MTQKDTWPDNPAPDRLNFADLTTITAPFGLLDEDTKERLKAWPHGWESFLGSDWCRKCDGEWGRYYTYRAKPAPD
jgi:hypothetical protein